MFVYTPNYTETLITSVMIFRDGAFGRYLVHECRAPEMGLANMWGYRKKAAICKPGRELSPDAESAGTFILDFPPSRIVRIFFFIL